MAKVQQRPMASPTQYDKDLKDFTATLQQNLLDLFESAHDHTVHTTAPDPNDGKPGDMWAVDNGAGLIRLYFKTQTGWHYITATA
jgi:hypothetical protein